MEVAKAEITTPFATPWRVIMLGSATDILATNIVYNLNDPCSYDDTSWIHPTKYMGVWWEMITAKASGVTHRWRTLTSTPSTTPK